MAGNIMTDEEYTRRGIYCPFCESTNISVSSPIDVDGTVALQRVKCLDCERQWDDRYKFIGFDAIEE